MRLRGREAGWLEMEIGRGKEGGDDALFVRVKVMEDIESLCVPRLVIFSVDRSNLTERPSVLGYSIEAQPTHSLTDVSKPPLYACAASAENAHARTAARWSNLAFASLGLTPFSPIS